MGRYPGEIQVNDDLPIQVRREYMSGVFDKLWEEVQATFFSERVEKRRKYKERQNIESGDVVAVRELNVTRGSWVLGRVLEVHQSADGLVRSVKVEKADKKVTIVGINRLSLISREKAEQGVDVSDQALHHQRPGMLESTSTLRPDPVSNSCLDDAGTEVSEETREKGEGERTREEYSVR
jgi:hypothetical protein